MKVKFVSEGINFERGRDPKDAMGIGLFNRRKFENIDDLSDWLIQVMPKIMDVPEIPKDILGTSSGLFLDEDYYDEIENWILDNNIAVTHYGDIDDWAGEVGAKLMGMGFEKVPRDNIEESVNFERGQDPKDAMGIGLSRMERFLMKVDELAEEFGFDSRLVKEPDQYTNVHIRKYERRNQDTLDLWAYRQGPLEPVDIRDRKMGNIFSSYKFVHWGAPDRKVPAEDWGKKRTWKRIFGKPIKKDYNWKNESVNFERGQDPRKSMDIGARKDPDTVKIVSVEFFNTYSGETENLSPEGSHRFLKRIQEGDTEDWLWYALKTDGGETFHIKNLLGRAILFDDVIYSIPEDFPETNITESVNFERGKDPKTAMGIGASKDAYVITKAMRRYDGRLGSMPEEPFLEILEDPTQWNRNDVLLKGPRIGDHNEWKTINLMSSEYPDIIYKGKYYNLRQPTDESVNFERGMDPKNAMGIGLNLDDWLTLKQGDIIRAKRNSRVTSTGTISSSASYDNIPKGRVFVLTDPIQEYSDGWVIRGQKYPDVKSTKSKKNSYGWDSFSGKPGTIKNRFEVIRKDGVMIMESVNFERGKDPKNAMGIGIRQAIKDWLSWVYGGFSNIEGEEFIINDDNSIDFLTDFEVPDKKFIEFPEYINFRSVQGDFMIDYCGLKSLRGCPELVHGFFSCEGNDLMSLDGMPDEIGANIFVRDNPGKFTYADVKKQIGATRLDQKIYSEDTHVRESVNFERGRDPRAVMGIGNEGMAIKMIDEQVNPLGLTMNPPYDILSQGGGNAIGRIYAWKNKPQSSEVELDVYHDGRMTFYAVNSEDGYISLSELESIMELLEKKELGDFINLI